MDEEDVPVANARGAAVATVGAVDGLLALRQSTVLARPKVGDLRIPLVSAR